MSEAKQKSLSRRKFLINAGAFTAGALAAGSIIGAIEPKNAEGAAPALPWTYQPLDLETVRRRGYENYFLGGCCYAVAKALLDTLVETVGTPWDTIPVEMFKYGKGGALGWGTICGTLNGSLYIMNLATGSEVSSVGHELIGWYSEYPFPSTLMDSYAQYKSQKQTVAHSPLCHQSVSIWCYNTHNEVNSSEKYDRCAKVAGDTAAKAADLLNQWYAGTLTPIYQPSAEFTNCMTCHTGSTSTYDNEQGLMNCIKCHDDKVDNHY